MKTVNHTPMKFVSWQWTLAVLLLLSSLLTACGGANNSNSNIGNQNGSNAAAGEATPAANNGNSSQEQTPTAPSGKVVVYTAGPEGLAAKIKEGFEAKYGITVEQFDGTTGKVLGRLEAEKSNPVADIVILASWPSAMAMKQEGWTQGYPEAANVDKLQPDWVDSDYHLFGYSASALGITYNTKLVSEPPTDWSDLTDPKWAGAVNIPDPSLSGSALDFISGYLNDKGEEEWSFFSQLKENGVAMSGANKEALDPVITGAKSIVMAGVDYMAYSAKAKGEPVDIVYPASGTVINPRAAMIMKTSPNLDNARLFIDYLLSDEAQALVTGAYLLPGRADIKADNRTNTEDIKLLDYDWNWMSEQGEAISAKFLELFK
ncbi:ABC transporter substrate-binding protein [Paenibacillus montaniterrae]|uniref:ABC transporter substrate-binding protein n=1 Tax=Paenibacillus montaniterrae TaxID=429341 RepID=A0A919YJV9_9BACL|nr:ABC transporter substrate-binding protein [Paenibacillus montaniterrae]GIP15238.1 ABC transporter substrate-binding protein [Paenibacillus montaniterrae]